MLDKLRKTLAGIKIPRHQFMTKHARVSVIQFVLKERERDVGLYGTVFYLKNPTPPGAAHAT